MPRVRVVRCLRHQIAAAQKTAPTKALGESKEVWAALVIGSIQFSAFQWNPEEFDEYATIAKELGFKGVASKPLVRSSYKAAEFYEQACGVKLL